MARKRPRTRRYFTRKRNYSKKPTIPIAVVAGFASPIARTVQHGIQSGITGPEGAIAELSRITIGLNPFATPMTFESWRLRYGLLPILVGVGVHKLAGMLGVNRLIAQTGIPLIRI